MRAFVLAALATLASTGRAVADPANDAAATQAFEDGKRLADLREWTQAIAKFKEAYRRRPDAAAMWAIAQTYEQQGDCVEATNFYRTFQRNFPNDKNVPVASKEIAELAACVRQRIAEPAPLDPKPHDPNSTPANGANGSTSSTGPGRGDPAPPRTSGAPATTEEPPRQVDDDPLATRRTVGKIVALAGILGVAVGAYFTSDARSLSDQVSGGSGVWNPDLEARGKAAQRNAIIAFTVGGAAIATGTILWVLARPSEPAPRVGVVPTANGAFVVWSGSL